MSMVSSTARVECECVAQHCEIPNDSGLDLGDTRNLPLSASLCSMALLEARSHSLVFGHTEWALGTTNCYSLADNMQVAMFRRKR